MTPAFDLPAQWVIHTVGPVWRGGQQGEAEQLASCYRRSLELAIGKGVRTIAFPGVSTGVYGYPKNQAARVAVETARDVVEEHPGALDEIVFCAFDDDAARLLRQALDGRGH